MYRKKLLNVTLKADAERDFYTLNGRRRVRVYRPSAKHKEQPDGDGAWRINIRELQIRINRRGFQNAYILRFRIAELTWHRV